MRQRVVLAPRNAGEAVAVAVSAVLIAGSVVAVLQREPQAQPVPASVVAQPAEQDVRTVSRPGPDVDDVEFGVDGSRLPRIPVFVEEAPKVLANVVAKHVGHRVEQRSTNPSASAPLLEGLGPSQPVPTPTGVSIVQDFPVAFPPASTATPSSAPSSSAPTTTPTTTPPAPSTAPTASTPPSATPTPSTTPAPTTSAPPTSAPTPNASPAPEGTPAGGTSTVNQPPSAPAATAPAEGAPAPSGGSIADPKPQSGNN